MMVRWDDENDPTAHDSTTLVVAFVFVVAVFLLFAEVIL